MGLYEEITARIKKEGSILYKINGKVEEIKYTDFFNTINEIAQKFQSIGIKKGARIGIYMRNSPQWIAIDLACMKLGAVSVPIGTTVSKDNVKYIIEDSGIQFLFTDSRDKLTDKDVFLDLNLKFQDSIKNLSENVKKSKIEGVKNNDEATICYTSGSTGKPKGVILTHGNILFNLEKQPFNFDSSDRLLSFLPLSHMYERTAGMYLALYNDVSICIAESIEKVLENAAEFKPTYFLTVPRLLEKVYKKTNEKALARILVKIGAGKIIGKKINRKLGGKIRFIISGGAAISVDLLKWFEKIGLNIYQGYGMTEAAPLISVNSPKENAIGSVGKPLEGVKIKIGKKGTLLIKSPGLMKGYTIKGEMEKRLEDGWFDTGDFAEIKEGYIFLNGRIDDLIIMSNGKKVYPEFIEKNIEDNGIENVFVYGSGRNYLSALVFDNHLDKNQIEKVLEEVNKKVSSFESIKKFSLIDKAFNISDGTLTPTLKKQRKKIVELYKNKLDSMYNE